MASVTKYPSSVSQSSVSTKNKYHAWANLDNLKNSSSSSYAQCGGAGSPLQPKSASSHNRPAKFVAKFNRNSTTKFNVPTYADVDSIVVEYAHSIPASSGKYANVGAPKISLYNGTKLLQSKTGVKPGKTTATKKLSFNSFNQSIVNSTDFNIKIEYPSNVSSNKGYVRMNILRVTVNYTVPSYTLTAKRVNTQQLRKDDTFEVDFSIKNKNKTNYHPKASIKLVEGLSYVSKSSGGSITRKGNTITWDTGFTKKVAETKLRLKLRCDDIGDKEITLSTPSPVSSTKTLGFTVKPVPFTLENTKIVEETTYVGDGLSFKISETHPELYENVEDVVNIRLETSATNVTFLEDDTSITLPYVTETDEMGQTFNVYTWTPPTDIHLTNTLECSADTETSTKVESSIEYPTKGILQEYVTNVLPANIHFPYYAAFILKEQETDRMGEGYIYQISSEFYVKDPNEFYIDGELTDYGINHRLGVFNSPLNILVDDPNCHTTSWNVTGFTRDTSDDTQTTFKYNVNVGGEQTALQSRILNVANWKLTTTITVDVETDLNKCYFSIGDLDIPFSRLGIPTGTSELMLYYDGNDVYVNVNEEVVCVLDDYSQLTNNKLGVKSTGADITLKKWYLTEENHEYSTVEIFEAAKDNLILGDCPELTENWEQVDVTFAYDKSAPVVIFILGEPDNIGSSDVGLDFKTPSIQEELTEDQEYNLSMNYPENIIDILSDDKTASLTGDSTPFMIYDFEELKELDIGDDHIVNGVSVSFTYETPDNVTVIANLHVGDSVGTRTVAIKEGSDSEIVIGGEWDKWGLQYSDFNEIQDLQIELIVQQQDILEDPTVFTIKNLYLHLYHRTIEESPVTCTIGGEDLRNYGLFITSVDVPFGLKTNTQYLEVEGTDTNKAYRMNISKKEISINYRMDDCSLVQNGKNLKQLVKLLTNRRNSLNEPILKRIEFSHFPDEYFEYILEDEVSAEAILSQYEGTIKLTIPAGTSYNKEPVVSANIGTNNGLVKVSPQINLKNLRSDITINQGEESWHIVHSDFKENDLLEINCQERTCIWYELDPTSETEKRNPRDVTEYVDFTSDWFVLDGDFEFTSSGADILSVIFYERN